MKKAKIKAKKLIHEKFKYQYPKLFLCDEQLKITNLRTTVVLKKKKGKKSVVRFKRFYVCLGPLLRMEKCFSKIYKIRQIPFERTYCRHVSM